MLNVKIKKTHPLAQLPSYATNGAACFDLHAMLSNEINISPFQTATIETGLSFEIPEGHVMLIYSRSGHGFKNDVRLSNCTGVIDSDYRGSVLVKLVNESSAFDFTVKNGDRIAQAMVIPVQQVSFEEVSELSSTERGNGGFGSTGA
jgi:dUTP pyrophosphatase